MKKITEILSESLYPKGTFICPICGTEFKANDDTRYIIAGGYVCNWKCFWNEVKKRESQSKKETKDKK